MGVACNAVEGEERFIPGFWLGNLKGWAHLGDPVVDRRIVLRWIFRK
jgi:hypothetical protein